MNSSRVVFCDFDGTITTKDTFVSVIEKFAPQATAQFLPAIFQRKISLKEGLNNILGAISTRDYPAIIRFMATQPVRPGLKEFIEFLNSQTIPFVVISGGLTGMVKTVLEHQQLMAGVTAIYAGEVDITGDFLQPYCEISSDTEFVAKAIIMAQYSAEEKIAIGDSVTDINMSLAADLVFARDRLKHYLDTENKPYVQWHDFFEIRDYLAASWQVNE
ncbi:2-hydroxy-3-keto-5-methylthiopentenyl-1-phosphate phosphatase [Pleurocapsa sp. CCALA 161]|uniref:MtnX-like HAD-IB family phosphatase n=1 Tax=Pleurocapsa sp. CCALA 161 TaxID=2107688 RepID=UPI000D04FB5C|nr:MtnX-like HAD-IB family phosphatase [Pleurocapsa sp. CCALA 161]PSB09099.1 2-hydroxy-3-keto-5-methylthiopentenyl-1-phosphate phosphatase [Pleurocapsa sp. CCALA 161]